MKQVLVLFDTSPAPSVNFAVHPSDANNKDYKAPILEREEEITLPVGTMSPNDDGGWTIRLSASPSGRTLVAKPLA